MTETLQKHLEAIDEMMSAKVGKNQVVPIYRVGHLAKILGDKGGLHGTVDEGFKSLLNRMQQLMTALRKSRQLLMRSFATTRGKVMSG